jgi:type VI secretion system secreted protein VgrG
MSDTFLSLAIEDCSSGLSPVSFEAEEGLSRLFHFRLELNSDDEGLDPGALVGKEIQVQIETGTGGDRYFHGIIRRLSVGGQLDPGRNYIVDVVPKLWRLTKRADCRIFQSLAVPDIVKKVLEGAGLASGNDFRLSLADTYGTREYCVQYRETDFQFISRLLEEEGIFYYFEHAQGKHTLVIVDSNTSLKACVESTGVYRTIESPEHPFDRVIGWQYAEEIRSGKFTLRDYDFKKPALLLEALTAGSINPDLEIYDYPGLYVQPADGTTVSQVRLEAESKNTRVVLARSTYRTFTAGGTFTLAEHERDNFNTSYVITSIAHSASADGKYQNRFEAIPTSVPYRPDVVTPKPLIGGIQTAVVVGSSGEEIYPDQYGRIKVQFYWDRLGKNDEKSSCWVRCAQSWAGTGAWGVLFIPRIKDEVVVTFLEGNPDRPLVIGAVYNGVNVTGYALPDNKTRSYLKTNSSTGGGGSNELRFEDKKSSEEIYIHAQKDLNTIVENDETLTIGSSNAVDGSQTISVYKDRTLTVQTGNESYIIQKGNRSVEIDQGNESTTIKQGNRTLEIDQGNDTLTIKQGNLLIQMSAGSGTVEAAEKITLKVGSNTIEIAQSGITVKGAMVSVEGQSQVGIKAPNTQVSGDAALVLKGGVVNIN